MIASRASYVHYPASETDVRAVLDALPDVAERTSVLALYGYAYDPERPDAALVTGYLRLKMLETFAHELAHNGDAQSRRPQGRWRASTEKAERHAEVRERVWAAEIAVPYVERTYAREYRALAAWVAKHVGSPVPLERLLDQPPNASSLVDDFEAAMWNA